MRAVTLPVSLHGLPRRPLNENLFTRVTNAHSYFEQRPDLCLFTKHVRFDKCYDSCIDSTFQPRLGPLENLCMCVCFMRVCVWRGWGGGDAGCTSGCITIKRLSKHLGLHEQSWLFPLFRSLPVCLFVSFLSYQLLDTYTVTQQTMEKKKT